MPYNGNQNPKQLGLPAPAPPQLPKPIQAGGNINFTMPGGQITAVAGGKNNPNYNEVQSNWHQAWTGPQSNLGSGRQSAPQYTPGTQEYFDYNAPSGQSFNLADLDKSGVVAPNDPRAGLGYVTTGNPLWDQIINSSPQSQWGQVNGNLPFPTSQWNYQNGYWSNSPQGGGQAPAFDFAGNPLGAGGEVYTQMLGNGQAGAYNPPSMDITRHLNGGRGDTVPSLPAVQQSPQGPQQHFIYPNQHQQHSKKNMRFRNSNITRRYSPQVNHILDYILGGYNG